MDAKTLERIDLMHPTLRKILREQYIEISRQLPKDVRLRFSHTLRTIKEQDDLYAMGRTAPGSIVTNSKGGKSIHNFGLAFDIVILLDVDKNGTFETAVWKGTHFNQVVVYFKSKGWEWGGDWQKFQDRPHFQAKKENGKSWTWQELSKLPKYENHPII